MLWKFIKQKTWLELSDILQENLIPYHCDILMWYKVHFKKACFFRNFLVLFRLKSIGIPAGIGQGTGLGLRDRDRDGIGLRHYRLRTTVNRMLFAFSRVFWLNASSCRSSRFIQIIGHFSTKLATYFLIYLLPRFYWA